VGSLHRAPRSSRDRTTPIGEKKREQKSYSRDMQTGRIRDDDEASPYSLARG
jgi:hypothetical protein